MHAYDDYDTDDPRPGGGHGSPAESTAISPDVSEVLHMLEVIADHAPARDSNDR